MLNITQDILYKKFGGGGGENRGQFLNPSSHTKTRTCTYVTTGTQGTAKGISDSLISRCSLSNILRILMVNV